MNATGKRWESRKLLNWSRKHITVVILAIFIIFSICIYIEHFLFEKNKILSEGNIKLAKDANNFPVKYTHLSKVIKGDRQEINILEIDTSNSRVEIRPVLSFDNLFGFEKLSSIYTRSGTYAAVNAGFFYEFGYPSGMVMIDGKILTDSTGKYPVFVFSNKKAYLREIETKVWISHMNKKIQISNMNKPGISGETVMYTSVYGVNNRVKAKNTTIIIKNNLVKEVLHSQTNTKIPKDGMLLTFFEPPNADLNINSIKIGDKIEFICEPDLGDDAQGYECGSWIVKNGKVVIGKQDEWVGIMTNKDPRTAIGIKYDGTTVLFTVDGRQPGYSLGLTGQELGEFLVSYGIKDAAMLDGGASTEMIVNGKIVNRPSFKGRERLLGGGITVEITD